MQMNKRYKPFWHEETQGSIKSLKNAIRHLEDDLRNPTKQRIAAITWDVCHDLFQHPAVDYFWETLESEEIRIYFWKAIPVELFEDFFDALEDSFLEHGCELDQETIKTYSSNESKYAFVNPDNGDRILVTIASGVCKQVSTGKMVPETKTDCGFLEDV